MRTAIQNLWRVIIVAATLTGYASAQDTVRTRGTDDSRLSFALGCEPRYSALRDIGVSPIIYQAPGIGTCCAVILDNNIWRYQLAFCLSGHILCKDVIPVDDINVAGYGATVHLRLGVERHLTDIGNWWIWAGGHAENWLAIDYNDRYMNACVGMSNLTAPTLSIRGERTTGRLTLSIAAGAAPFGWWYRPGFAYVANYTTGASEVVAFADKYGLTIAFLPLLRGEAGARMMLSSDNWIGVVYHWNFFTTRNSGAWRYEAAQHSVRMEIGIGF